MDDVPEVKKHECVWLALILPHVYIEELAERFSDWVKLKRCVAKVMKLSSVIHGKSLNEPKIIKCTELKMAETRIWKLVQENFFPAFKITKTSLNPVN